MREVSGAEVTPAERFPFGQSSTARPPRKPDGPAELFVLGVYPSALHVGWTPPAWAAGKPGIRAIGALAVDNEPVVFWDGDDPSADVLVDQWRTAVNFVSGDHAGAWGHVKAQGNGTSGRGVVERVLEPLGVEPSTTWFTDAIDRFFIKKGTKRRPGQAEAMADRYGPFAQEVGLPPATLPRRPTRAALVKLAAAEHRERLVNELTTAAAPLVVTLGEEARRVLSEIADEASTNGAPTLPLTASNFAGSAAATYGERGSARVAGQSFGWHALVHPGQRSKAWCALHDQWIERRQS